MKTVFSRLTALVLSPMVLAAAVLSLSPIPAQAAATGSSIATLAQPLSAPRQEVVDGVLWKCAGDRCAAPRSESRPAVACQRVAKKFGEVARFSVAGNDVSAETLAKCNGK